MLSFTVLFSDLLVKERFLVQIHSAILKLKHDIWVIQPHQKKFILRGYYSRQAEGILSMMKTWFQKSVNLSVIVLLPLMEVKNNFLKKNTPFRPVYLSMIC